MWSVWTVASKFNRLPSDIVDEEHELDSLTRYLINKAITYFGMTVENWLHETVEVGAGNNKHSERKYELSELLDPAFKMARPQPKAKQIDSVQSLMILAAQNRGIVKVWGYTGNDAKPS